MKKIVLQQKKKTANNQGVIKLTKEALEALVEIADKADMSLRMAASEIILQAINNGLIDLGEEEDEED